MHFSPGSRYPGAALSDSGNEAWEVPWLDEGDFELKLPSGDEGKESYGLILGQEAYF